MSRWLTQFRLALRSVFLESALIRNSTRNSSITWNARLERDLIRASRRRKRATAASHAMGGIAKSKEECRDMQGVNFIDDLLRISGMPAAICAGVRALPP